MTPTEKHMEAARTFVREHFNTSKIVDPEAYAERIAKAMTIGEREGMKRAAEIADSHCMDHDEAELCQGCGEIISAAILAEAGEA